MISLVIDNRSSFLLIWFYHISSYKFAKVRCKTQKGLVYLSPKFFLSQTNNYKTIILNVKMNVKWA